MCGADEIDVRSKLEQEAQQRSTDVDQAVEQMKLRELANHQTHSEDQLALHATAQSASATQIDELAAKLTAV